MRNLGNGLKKGTIVTDTASVKVPITRAATEIFKDGVTFIGGHPMTGSEKSGIEAAQPLLFQNSVYVLTPSEDTPHGSLEVLIGILKELGARVLLTSSELHDRITAAVSHLPQILAVELVNLIDDLSAQDANYISLAAGGFRDMTRIASSNYSMWKDILYFNAQNIAEMIDLLQTRLSAIRENLKSGSIDSLKTNFVQANMAREKIPRGAKGFLQSLYDLSIMVDDKPGMLFEITRSLFEKGINIKDIELIKVREGSGGVFRISFESREIMNIAAETLDRKGFTVLSRDRD
ncbi:MAG: prephenate dehydrogenase/arogenate dehydrogenase family protein, partial [Candidatus Kryptoniota bacterium]